MQVIRLSHKNYLDVIESALSDGSTVLLENIGETVCTVEFQRMWGGIVVRKKIVTENAAVY
jgi:hypothetical protein